MWRFFAGFQAGRVGGFRTGDRPRGHRAPSAGLPRGRSSRAWLEERAAALRGVFQKRASGGWQECGLQGRRGNGAAGGISVVGRSGQRWLERLVGRGRVSLGRSDQLPGMFGKRSGGGWGGVRVAGKDGQLRGWVLVVGCWRFGAGPGVVAGGALEGRSGVGGGPLRGEYLGKEQNVEGEGCGLRGRTGNGAAGGISVVGRWGRRWMEWGHLARQGWAVAGRTLAEGG